QTWCRLLQDVVEVVAIDGHELAILEDWQRVLGLRGQVCQNADDERQFRLLHGAVGLNVVSDLYARPAYPVQFVLLAFASHDGISLTIWAACGLASGVC